MAALAAMLLGGPAPERDLPLPPPVRFGLSDQHPEVFGLPAQQRLGVGLYREIIDWDIATSERQQAHESAGTPDVHAERFQRWYEAVGPYRAEALVSFGGDEQGGAPPSPEAAGAAFDAFRRRYPAITHFTAFNEPNLRPFRDDPSGAGALYRAIGERCRAPDCTLLAGDFADLANLRSGDYLRAYKRAAGIEAADARGDVTWATHVYHSAFSEDGAPREPRGAAAVLAQTHGDVWITEAGAFSYLRRGRHPIERPAADEMGPRHDAAVDLDWMLDRYVDREPRVKRFYYYQWADHTGGVYDAKTPDDSFGTGLVRTASDPGVTQTYCVYAHRADRAARHACLR